MTLARTARCCRQHARALDIAVVRGRVVARKFLHVAQVSEFLLVQTDLEFVVHHCAAFIGAQIARPWRISAFVGITPPPPHNRPRLSAPEREYRPRSCPAKESGFLPASAA